VSIIKAHLISLWARCNWVCSVDSVAVCGTAFPIVNRFRPPVWIAGAAACRFRCKPRAIKVMSIITYGRHNYSQSQRTSGDNNANSNSNMHGDSSNMYGSNIYGSSNNGRVLIASLTTCFDFVAQLWSTRLIWPTRRHCCCRLFNCPRMRRHKCLTMPHRAANRRKSLEIEGSQAAVRNWWHWHRIQSDPEPCSWPSLVANDGPPPAHKSEKNINLKRNQGRPTAF